ncbi:hypothetical protein FNU76_09100 [Chitinimonas arctica]|uniref:Uncharacterized protein n=1 Tax=Chitinimonas arctica TaxID=2594795 RepID=A0A516SEE8_9NEIS|nr:hypothetical protein [Chitinimonas arctica]QDQ26513.1 hypothetical protein FNU76_09100 [Chitinimonas arctica]
MAIERFYLFVTDIALTLWQGEADKLAQAIRFSADSSGVAEFELLIASHPTVQWFVLLDLQEEDYRIETIPHVNARDHKLVVRRRLDQLYRESRYRSATLQGREEGGRRDDRLLFAALTNPMPLDLWLRPLLERDARIVGVYSVALLTAHHINLVPEIPARALIVSRQSGSGLRQTYLADGNLRFSRLTALEENGPDGLAAQLSAEAARARQFLASLRAVERNEALQVVTLCGTQELAALRAACPDTELIQFSFLPLEQVGAALGVYTEAEVETVEPLWLRFIAAKRPANQYATADQLKPYQAWQAGRALWVMAVLLLLGGVLTAASLSQSAHQLDQQATALDQRRLNAERTYRANVPQVKEGQLTPTGMKNVVNAYQQLVERWPTLAASLIDISAVVNRYPMLELDALAWQVSDNPRIVPAGFAGTDADKQTVAEPEPAVDADGNPVAGAAPRYVIIAIKGRLLDYEHRYREALALVDELAKAFVLRPGVSVEKLQLPIDVRPESAIDLANDKVNDIAGAPFSLKIVLPLPARTTEEAPA